MKDKIKNIAEKLEHQIRMHELDLNDRIKDIPQIRPVDPYPIIPLYADNDGLWYYYTIWHLEQIARLQSK